MNLQRRKSLTKYFTGAHHRHKSMQLILMYEASKLYGLLLCESAENDIVSLTGVSTSCLHICGTFLQRVSNIVAYHILVIACFVFDIKTALYSFVGLVVKSFMIDESSKISCSENP